MYSLNIKVIWLVEEITYSSMILRGKDCNMMKNVNIIVSENLIITIYEWIDFKGKVQFQKKYSIISSKNINYWIILINHCLLYKPYRQKYINYCKYIIGCLTINFFIFIQTNGNSIMTFFVYITHSFASWRFRESATHYFLNYPTIRK